MIIDIEDFIGGEVIADMSKAAEEFCRKSIVVSTDHLTGALSWSAQIPIATQVEIVNMSDDL